MINNRQSGRRRGRGGSGQRPSGSSSSGQRDSGNRIDSRARGNAAQLLEKYKNMARDAQMQGDRVNTEYYLQFADHYFRVLSDGRSRNDEQRPQSGANNFDDGDEDYGDEGEPIRAGEQQTRDEDGNRSSRDDGRYESSRNDSQRRDYQQPRDSQNRDNQSRDGQNRDSQNRDYPSRDTQNRDSQNRDYPSRDTQNRDYQPRESQPRDNQPRESQNRDNQSRDTQNRDQSRDQPPRDYAPRDDNRNDQRAPRPSQTNGHGYRNGAANDRDETVAEPAKAEKKPAARPRKPAPAMPAAEPAVFDATLLPPSLGIAAEPAAEEKPKPRRGRPPKSEATQAS